MDITNYYKWKHLEFFNKPDVPLRWYLGVDENTTQIPCKERVLSEDEVLELLSWCETVRHEAIALSAIDSVRNFAMSDHTLLAKLFRYVCKSVDISENEASDEPYMSNYIHYLNMTGNSQMPFLHDCNVEHERYNERFYVCLKKSLKKPYSGMIYYDKCIFDVDVGCFTCIHPAEKWYTFVTTSGDQADIIWITFGITQPLAKLLKSFDAQAIEAAKGRVENQMMLKKKKTFTELCILTDASYASVLPKRDWPNVGMREESLLSNLKETFKNYIVRNRQKYPAVVLQYNSMMMQVSLNDLDFTEFIDHHNRITQRLAETGKAKHQVVLHEAYLVHIYKGGFYHEETTSTHTVLIVLNNTMPYSLLYSGGTLYPFDEGITYFIDRKFGITTNMSDDVLVVLKLIYNTD